MKPITNILLVLALVFYVFLPIIEISHTGTITGMDFFSSLLTYNETKLTIFAFIPFITIFLAIAFNCLKSRWWGIIDAILILMAIFYFVNMLTKFQGLPLAHNPDIASNTEMSEGMSIIGLKSGYHLCLGSTILALISALVSLMPFQFNKRIEESFDKRIENRKKQIGKMGHTIHDEIHKLGKHSKNEQPEKTATEQISLPEEPEPSTNDDSQYKPKELSEDEKYKDYMPKE